MHGRKKKYFFFYSCFHFYYCYIALLRKWTRIKINWFLYVSFSHFSSTRPIYIYYMTLYMTYKLQQSWGILLFFSFRSEERKKQKKRLKLYEERVTKPIRTFLLCNSVENKQRCFSFLYFHRHMNSFSLNSHSNFNNST